MNIPKITVMVDHGYNLEYITRELEKIYPQIMTKIKFKLAPKPSKAEKEASGKSGFVVREAGDRQHFDHARSLEISR